MKEVLSMENEKDNHDHFLAQESELVRILEAMLNDDTTISARAVANRHTQIKSASSFTRHPDRQALISKYQERQSQHRTWQKRLQKTSSEKANQLLATKDELICELEMKNRLLITSHIAMLKAVGEMGGFAKWSELFKDFQQVRRLLHEMNAMPNADVHQL